MKKTPAKLTPRQWELYNYLLKDKDSWHSPREIYENVSGYKWNEKSYDKCIQIRFDKQDINSSNEVDSIIVMKNRCFKIASYEEYKCERNAHVTRLLNQIEEIRNMDRKAKKDGQFKLISNKGDVIDDKSKAKPYIDTFRE